MDIKTDKTYSEIVVALMAEGFVNNPYGSGFHIVRAKKKIADVGKRLHAVLTYNGVSIHRDVPLEGKKHKVSKMTIEDKKIFRRIKRKLSNAKD